MFSDVWRFRILYSLTNNAHSRQQNPFAQLIPDPPSPSKPPPPNFPVQILRNSNVPRIITKAGTEPPQTGTEVLQTIACK
jgi:hypothetical protein